MLIFSFDYPPNDGGIARLSAEVARGFARSNQPVAVLTQRGPVSSSHDITADLPGTVRVTRQRPQREWQALRQLRMLDGQGVCISGIWYPDGLLAMLAGLQPHIILAHGGELLPPRQRWRRRLWALLRRRVLESAALVVANSHYTAHLVRQVAPAARVAAVPLAVDACRFKPGDRAAVRRQWGIGEEIVLCSVSRIHRYKGYETVFQAIAALPETTRARLVYLIAGKGADQPWLQAYAERLGIGQQVRWLGFIAEEDLPSLYTAADLFILATRQEPDTQAVEGFGLVFLEAQACATPVIGTRTGGIPDAITPGQGGWLIEQDDAAGLSALIHELATHPEQLTAMGKLARQRVEREYTWSHYMDRFTAALHAHQIDLTAHHGEARHG